ncbi:hypothetical protein ACEPPN_016689 [Leptodophora sp. 'Broadleaf-Isolate-01']
MSQDDAIATPLCCKRLRCRHRRRAIKLINGTKTVRPDWEKKTPKPPTEKDSISLGRSSKRLFLGLKGARPNLVYGVTGISPKDSSANLGSLPYDLIYKIFQACSPTRAVAIGLSSKRLYNFLRLAHPNPIPLDYNDAPCFGDYEQDEDALYTMLGLWMPKHYRTTLARIPEVPKQFVNMKVYGFMHSWKDKALWSYYMDRAAASVDGKMYYEEGFKSYLPDVEALQIIRQDTKRFQSKIQWRKFWSKCKIFKKCGPVKFPKRVVEGKLADGRAVEKKARARVVSAAADGGE